MTSRFRILADLIRSPADAERPKSREERERERAELRRDMAEGAEMARKFAAKQAEENDPEAAYLAHCKRQALLIVEAGARARGLPVPTRLVQDEPGPGDDRPYDPQDKGKKSKKKAKPAKADDDEEAEEKDENEDDFDSGDEKERRGAANPAPGESEAEYWVRVNRTAAGIVAAGAKRRRGY